MRAKATEGTVMSLSVSVAEPPAANGLKSVAFQTDGGTARPGVDYTPTRGRVEFGPGEHTKTVRVQTLRDGVSEGAETVGLRLFDARGFTLSPAGSELVGTILDGPTADVPLVTGVAIVSDPGADATYGPGDTVRVRLAFDQAVSVDTAGGTPRLAIDLDPADWGRKAATYESGSGTAALTFAFGPVASPNVSTRGVAVLADTLETGGGTIRSVSTGVDALLDHAGLDHDPAHRVDWALDPNRAPAVDEGSRHYGTFTAPGNAPRGMLVSKPIHGIFSDPDGDELAYTVALADGGQAGLVDLLRLTTEAELASSHHPREVALRVWFRADAEGDWDAVAPALPNPVPITVTLTATDPGGLSASVRGVFLGHWEPRTPPSVTAVAVASDAGPDDTYALGDTIRVALTFDEPVEVDTAGGVPTLAIDMDPAEWGEKQAAYEGGSGTATLTFTHPVVEPNYSTQGIAVLANSLALNGGTIRAAATGADAALGHAGLGHDPRHKVDWRPALSVADARANEGADAAVAFPVRLSRAASGTVTVDYATADGTATADEDYERTRGTLTFAVGETEKTVSVPILDDGHDEGEETFTLKLRNAEGAWLADDEATGTIVNADPIPKAWLARFGRTVASHVVDALAQRLDDTAPAHVRLGGHGLGGGAEPDAAALASRLAPDRSVWEEAEAASAGQDMTLNDLLMRSSFHLVSESDGRPTTGPRLSAWGLAASSRFDGRQDALSLNGTVTTATLGVDAVWKRWLSGLVLAYSDGDGSYTEVGAGNGGVASTLTSVHPYVAYTLSDRVKLWGMVGYGQGSLRLLPAGQGALDTDLSMTTGAVGVRGHLTSPATGFTLTLRSDALWTQTSSEAVPGLVATDADASRLRLVLEGSRRVALVGGGSFTPSLEIGLRHDGGDAETGTGLEVGGRLRYASAWGLSIEASVRGLLAHEASNYQEWGASAALRFDPSQDGLGLTASVSPTWGAAASGMARLWDQTGTAGLAPDNPLATDAAGRLEAELGYGLATLRGRGLLTPYARVALTEGADQAWHLGTRLALAESLNLSLEASRRAREGERAAHEVALRANLGF